MHRFLTPLLFTGGVSFILRFLLLISMLVFKRSFGKGSVSLRQKRKLKTRNLTATDKAQLAHRYAIVVAKWSPNPQGTL